MNLIKRLFNKKKPELTNVKLIMSCKTSPQYLKIDWNDGHTSELNIN